MDRNRSREARPPRMIDVSVIAPGTHGSRGRTLFAACLIGLVVLAVLFTHWPALSARTICFDDHEYLLENRLVRNPNWDGAWQFLREVFEPSTVRGYYQPLTMISLMLDHALGGRADDLRIFHRTNLLLHAANTALIIALVYLLFDRLAAALAAGLLFGVHPLSVEPIVWIAERKTVLAGFFGLICMVSYAWHTRRGGRKAYWLSLLAFVAALMSKPTTTLIPVALLLLDYWPLRRLSRQSVVEKAPFFAVAFASAVITVVSQGRTAGVDVASGRSMIDMALILCHNIVFYLGKIFWPTNLSSHYPFPEPLSAASGMMLAAVVGTVLLIGILLVSLRRTRAAATGWLIFFLLISPTMGVIGFTRVIAADKFAYFPAVGLLLVFAALFSWAWDRAPPGRSRNLLRIGLVGLVLSATVSEAELSRNQLSRWQDSVRYYRYMLALAPETPTLQSGLANVLVTAGQVDEGIEHYREALRLDPDFHHAHANLADVLLERKQLAQAVSHYYAAMKSGPADHLVQLNIGYALAGLGRYEEAFAHFSESLKTHPEPAAVLTNIGNVKYQLGDLEAAIGFYEKALRADPNHQNAIGNLAKAYVRRAKAIQQDTDSPNP